MKHIGFLSFGHWTPSPQSQDADGVRRAAAIDRARRRRRGARRRRRLFPRPSLRPPARLAVPAARGLRRAHQAHRDRHRGHRHALREPALHGGGRRRRRPHRRRPPAARHLPRLARAGDRRLAPLRLRAGRGHDRRRHGAAPRRGFPRGDPRRGLRQAQSAARCSRTRPACCASSLIPRGLRERIWWGAGTNATAEWAAKLGMNLQSSTLKIDESGKPFHVQQAEQIRLYRRRGRRPGTRGAAGVGDAQHLRADGRPRPHVFRARPQRGPDRLPRRQRARHLRPQLRRRAGCADRGA